MGYKKRFSEDWGNKMEFDPVSRFYVPDERDGQLIGQHHPVHIDNTYQVGKLIERARDTIVVNGGDPLGTPATRRADEVLGLVCLHSDPKSVFNKF